MGKVTGFLEYARVEETSSAPSKRRQHYREFVSSLDNEEAKTQGARCMDCGIPFCHNACPVNNIIPDWNDLVYRNEWRQALDILHSTNNFPEVTGRICPAPCEAACTLNINDTPVGIKSIEHFIIDKGWSNGWVAPQISTIKTGRRVAIVGSGPAGLSCAQQLARAGHSVSVFEKNDRLGGLMRYGIPDFKLDKTLLDRRITQMQAEGVEFHTGVRVGKTSETFNLDLSQQQISPEKILQEFDALVIAGGAEHARDLPVPGRSLEGVHFAMEFLPQQNRLNAGDKIKQQISAKGKHVIVIGGGDTGSDCVGTSNRQGAASVTQFELLPMPPEHENTPLVWPFWPIKMRTSSSHEEGCQRDWSIGTKEFKGANGRVSHWVGTRLEWHNGKMQEVPNSLLEKPTDLVLLAMGFVSPISSLLQELGMKTDQRGNVEANTEGINAYQTSVERVFATGDMRRGQSLVVWAIREGRQCAEAVDRHLMGSSCLPR